MAGAILIISGPSGSGKSSLCHEMFKRVDNYYFSISSTTRAMRDREVNGIDYYFIEKSEFIRDIECGYFLEWAEVHGNFYGTSLKPVLNAIENNKLVIFDIDVQGHQSIKEKFPNITTSVFITTPTISELKQRLQKRNTDSDNIINNRIINAYSEMKNISKYDYLLINNDFDTSLNNLISIATVAKLKTSLFDVNDILKNWKDLSF
ncbi:MAG: guanylate kinase [Campylobacterales bacterium]|nr:guanylate kinase [Campylobacterales bacterium]